MTKRGDTESAPARRVLTDAATTGAAIRAARRRRGLTQQAMAQAAGVTRQSIVNLETGRSSPQRATVVAALRVLGLRLEVVAVDASDQPDSVQASTRRVRSAVDSAGATDTATSSTPARGP